MITKTIKLNSSVKVNGIVYWGIVAFPCAAPFTRPALVRETRPQTWACPLGTWVNPGGSNPNLTVVVKK